MTTRLLTEGDVERGQALDHMLVIDGHGWTLLPGTDVEVRAFTDQPVTLRYRLVRKKSVTATLPCSVRSIAPERTLHGITSCEYQSP